MTGVEEKSTKSSPKTSFEKDQTKKEGEDSGTKRITEVSLTITCIQYPLEAIPRLVFLF